MCIRDRNNLIPEWNDLVYQGRWDLAAKRLIATNRYPEFTSRVCPALCEAACTCGMATGSPVAVKENERAIVEYGYESGAIHAVPPPARTGKRVAVVGTGPSGLSVADLLNKRGHKVTMYERANRVGGLLMYGIPNMKLEKWVIDRRVKILEEEGIEFITNADVGRDVPAEELKENYDAVVLCCGAKKPRDIGVPGRDAEGIYFAVDYLTSVTKSLLDSDFADGKAVTAKGKKVLVTGGGGSIGSELCRQIAHAKPKQLIILDIYENNAYDIQMELRRTHPELNLEVIIGSVRDAVRLNHVMETYRPELVFHAAAHKHVPLMEESPNEAIKNNVIGTYKLAKAAAEYGVKRFVQISTDKAVNPTNIMGASKRLCEMVIQMMNRESKTEFVAVRFGNVLASNGSVIPLFKKQIEAGGPVTVTHPDIIRYFMTIPEAVSLVLQAGYYAKGGEIFILDMGEPVKIDTMARNMIRLSGYEPDVDIKIEYTGLRPGEKLYEELLMKEEGMQETANKLIHIGKPIEMDDALLEQQLRRLDEASRAESEDIKDIVAEIVPTYKRECKV